MPVAEKKPEASKSFIPYEPAPGEEYMNEKQLAHFRQLLLDWKQDLMEEVDRTVRHLQEDANNYADPADRATQEEALALNCAPGIASVSC